MTRAKLVPVFPTREMWAAGGNAVVGYKQRHHDKVVSDVWDAMLDASPATAPGATFSLEPADLAALDAILSRWHLNSDVARPSIKLGLLRKLRAVIANAAEVAQ